MELSNEKRRENRLGYKWPLLYGKSIDNMFSQGLMIDIASGGVAFVCEENKDDCPKVDQSLTVRFNIPRFDEKDPSATVSITRTGRICRVEEIKNHYYRIALQFDKSLTLKPGEQIQIILQDNNNYINSDI